MNVFCRGLNPVPEKEVIAMYEGSHVPLEIMSDFYGKVCKLGLFCLSIVLFDILKCVDIVEISSKVSEKNSSKIASTASTEVTFKSSRFLLVNAVNSHATLNALRNSQSCGFLDFKTKIL